VRACPIDRGLLVTNTKFTSEAVAYAECAGVELLGWSNPDEGNLFDLMTATRVYPVTALTSLKAAEKRLLVDSRIVAVGQIALDPKVLDLLRLPAGRVGEIRAEADGLLAHR
jgi:hypothetical protein